MSAAKTTYCCYHYHLCCHVPLPTPSYQAHHFILHHTLCSRPSDLFTHPSKAYTSPPVDTTLLLSAMLIRYLNAVHFSRFSSPWTLQRHLLAKQLQGLSLSKICVTSAQPYPLSSHGRRVSRSSPHFLDASCTPNPSGPSPESPESISSGFS